MTKRLILTAIVLCLTGFALGCGGDKVKEYKVNINQATAQLGEQLGPLAGAVTETSSADADDAAMHKIADALHQLSDRIGKIKPPEDSFKTTHDQLQRQIDEYADVVADSAGKDAASFANQTKLFSTNIENTVKTINDKN